MPKWYLKFLKFLNKYLHFKPVLFAIDLNGDADYVTFGDIAAIDTSTSLSVAGWFKVNNITEDHTLAAKMLTFNTPNRGGFLLFFDDVSSATARTNIIRIIITGEINVLVDVETDNNAILADTWYHVAFTSVLGSGTGLRLYIDGVEVSDGASTTVNVDHDGQSEALRIGDTAALASDNLKGSASEVGVWVGVILTANEMLQLASSRVKGMPLQIQSSNLTVYAPLDDFANGTALNTDADGYKDRSGSGNHGQGVDADNDSTNIAEEVLSYPQAVYPVTRTAPVAVGAGFMTTRTKYWGA